MHCIEYRGNFIVVVSVQTFNHVYNFWMVRALILHMCIPIHFVRKLVWPCDFCVWLVLRKVNLAISPELFKVGISYFIYRILSQIPWSFSMWPDIEIWLKFQDLTFLHDLWYAFPTSYRHSYEKAIVWYQSIWPWSRNVSLLSP